MSEVTATGMLFSIRNCVQRVAISSRTLYGIVVYRRRQTLYKSNYTGFLRALGNGRVEVEAYVSRFSSYHIFNVYMSIRLHGRL